MHTTAHPNIDPGQETRWPVVMRCALAALAVSAMFLAAHAGNARAADFIALQNLKTGQCIGERLEHQGHYDVYLLRMLPCNRGSNETWIRSGMGNGGYRFRNVDFGDCFYYDRQYGLRTYSCVLPYTRFAANGSFAAKSEGGSRFRLQALVGHGCIAGYVNAIVTVGGCVNASSRSYANQVWIPLSR